MATLNQIREKFPSARDLSDNEIIDRLSQASGVPYEQVARRYGFTKDTSSGFFGGAQDVVIEAANAAAGLVGSVGEMVSPGNRFSRAIQENIIEPGEAKQTVPTQLAKRELQRGLESSEFLPQAGAVGSYIANNPLLAAGQAVGSFAPIGLPARAAQGIATGLGFGAKAAGRAGLGTGATVSGAAAGGDAAGSAYELVMNTPREVLLAHPQAQELIAAGVNDIGQIYEELATRAARRASVVPAAIGAVAGATGAERALLRGVKGKAGVALDVGTEALTEGLEEGVTTYAGRKAAQQYNPEINPMTGVYGAGVMGAALGAGTALPISLARMERAPAPIADTETDLTSTGATAPTGFEFTGPAPRGIGPMLPASELAAYDPIAAIEARAAAGRPMSQAEQQQLLSSYFAAQRAGEQYTDLLTSQESTLAKARELGQQYQSMVGQRGDQMLTAQEVGLQARPIVARLQQEADAESARIAAAREAGVGAENLPGMTAGAGTVADFRRIMNPAVMQPVDINAPEPAARASIVPTAPAPFSNIRMDRPTQEVGQPAVPITERPVSPPPGVSGAVSPAAPVAAGASLEGDDAVAQSAIDELGLRPLAGNSGANLQASVQGGTIKVGGRPSYDAPTLAKASAAFLDGKGDKESKTAGGKLAQAARVFSEKYRKYLDAAGSMVPTESTGTTRFTLKKTKKFPQVGEEAQATARADQYVGSVQAKWNEAQQALSVLGEAAGNNAKNVEAMIRIVKDNLAKRKAKIDEQMQATEDGDQLTALAEEMKALEKLDLGLAQGWAAAKRGVFRNDADILDVRGGEIRTLKEEQKKGFEQPLVRAAKYGASVGPRSQPQTGFQGVLNYIRSKGTPFERMLAKAVSEVFKNTNNPPKIVFAEGKSQFDPVANTVTMSPTASPEVALHEALHAALQWYVHTNPKDPVVSQLLKAVDKVVKFDTSKLSPKAAEVQAVLAKLVKGNRNLDAALELVSYGNTLVEFRKALEAMPTKGTPESFVKSAKDVWNMILATVRRMLGLKSNTVAGEVIMNSFRLLERAASTKYQSADGKVLEASVQSNQTAATKQAEDIRAALDNSMNDLAKKAGHIDYTAYKDRPSTNFNLTRMLLENVGFGKDGKISKAMQEAARKSADRIRKDFPALEAIILNLNSKFGQSVEYKELADFSKQDAQTGILEAEYMGQYMYRNPADAEKIIRYLNDETNALKEEGRDATLRRMADNISRHIKDYIATLPEKDQRLFAGMKFSDYLLNPQSISQLAGKSIGIRSLGRKLDVETREETNIDSFEKYLPFKNGSLDLNAGLYQFFEKVPDGKGNYTRVPAGFIGKEAAAANKGLDIDRSRLWFLEKVPKQTGGQYVFSTRKMSDVNLLNTASKLASGKLSATEQEEAVQQISSALINTMAVLSHNYSQTNFFGGLDKLGRDENGAPTAQSVAFDSVDQINEIFGGRQITDDNVLDASSKEAETGELRAKTQRSQTWVRLPDSASYGAMRGKIIPGTVWNNILDMHDRSPLGNSRVLAELMTSFKKAKTVLTPATHVNNALTNYSLMLLHGIPHKALQEAAQMMYRYEASPKSLTKAQLDMMQEFYRSGAVLGQFTNVEAKKYITKKLAENITPDNDRSLTQKLAAWLGHERDIEQFMAQAARKGRLADNFFTELYAAGDNVFRLAAFLNSAANVQAANGGQTLTDAQLRKVGLDARKLFLDYDIDARWVRAARQSFLPFVSWPYAIAPVLGRLAIEKPWTMVNMMAALAVLAAATDDDDDWRKRGPEQVRESFLGVPTYFRVPFMGDEENPVYYNIGKSIPFMSLFQPPVGQVKLAGLESVPAAITPGGPYTALIGSLFFGIDAFTGKKLTDVSDSELNKVLKTAESAYNTMAPSVLSTKFIGPNEGDIAKLLQNRTGPTGVEPDALFLARTLGGLSLYEFNRSETAYYQDAEVKKMKREFGTIMNKAKKDEYAKGMPDYEALDEKLATLREKLEKRINEIRGDDEE